MNYKLSLMAIITSITVSGCSVFTIGEQEFSCNGKPDHGLCKGPMEVYELTNNQDNLEHLMMHPKNEDKHEHGEPVRIKHAVTEGEDITYVYKERSLRMQSADDYDKAEIVAIASDGNVDVGEYTREELDELREYNYKPYDIAPEPLAVLEEAKAMRIYVAAWEDKAGDLNIPGFVYVELQPRKWVSGHQAQMRPSRVLPFQVIKRSNEAASRQKSYTRGIDGLGISRPNSPVNN